jgi:hypothetical protein
LRCLRPHRAAKIVIMPLGGGCSKHGFGRTPGFGWASLGLPQGNVKDWHFVA